MSVYVCVHVCISEWHKCEHIYMCVQLSGMSIYLCVHVCIAEWHKCTCVHVCIAEWYEAHSYSTVTPTHFHFVFFPN